MVKLHQDLSDLTFNYLLIDLIAMPVFISTKTAEFTGRDAGQWPFVSLRLVLSLHSYMKHTFSWLYPFLRWSSSEKFCPYLWFYTTVWHLKKSMSLSAPEVDIFLYLFYIFWSWWNTVWNTPWSARSTFPADIPAAPCSPGTSQQHELHATGAMDATILLSFAQMTCNLQIAGYATVRSCTYASLLFKAVWQEALRLQALCYVLAKAA